MLKSKKFWVGATVSAVLLLLFFRQLDPGETLDALGGANYLWFVPAIGMYFIAVLFRSIRWHFLLRPLKTIPVRRLYPVVVVGYMANNLLPVRLGEFVRSYFLGQREGVSKSAALATIAIERVMDGVGLLLLALIVWPFLPVQDALQEFADDTGIAAGLLISLVVTPFVLFLAGFFAIAVRPSLGRRLVAFTIRFFPQRWRMKAARLMLRFIQGLASLSSPRRILAIVGLTLPVWLAEATMYFLIGLGFDLGLQFHGSVFVTALSNLATAVPSTAGGVGPFEYATRVTLEGLNVTAEVAAAYAIAIHAALLAPVTLAGLVFLWFRNTSFSELLRQGRGRLVERYEPSGARSLDR